MFVYTPFPTGLLYAEIGRVVKVDRGSLALWGQKVSIQYLKLGCFECLPQVLNLLLGVKNG